MAAGKACMQWQTPVAVGHQKRRATQKTPNGGRHGAPHPHTRTYLNDKQYLTSHARKKPGKTATGAAQIVVDCGARWRAVPAADTKQRRTGGECGGFFPQHCAHLPAPTPRSVSKSLWRRLGASGPCAGASSTACAGGRGCSGSANGRMWGHAAPSAAAAAPTWVPHTV